MNDFVITDRDSLLQALAESNRRVTAWFSAIPAGDFFVRQPGSWSPSDNLDHLIRSVKPVSLALKMPGILLWALFGSPAGASRSYNEICEVYKGELAAGAQAAGRYLPQQRNSGNQAEAQKMKLIGRWVRNSSKLVSAAQGWQEARLDEFQLPHPILGNLTVREMLFFTTYHNLRHASQAGD
jgi:hypothetical protein